MCEGSQECKTIAAEAGEKEIYIRNLQKRQRKDSKSQEGMEDA